MGTTVVGIRELKAHLSQYLRDLRLGGSITVTDRGRPVARLIPVRDDSADRLADLLEAGLVCWDGRALPPSEPIAQTLDCRTVGDVLLGERE